MEPIDFSLVGDDGPLEYSPLDDFDKGLIAAREALPDFDIYRVSYGYIGVPADTTVFMAVDTDGLVAKLRRHPQQDGI
jgi:hypothetical protein